ncbi:MAG TPA: ATP-binding protein, partial [Actinokineospora sp.]|nr:ATP-binding protein [Actinokineospora sp.]
PALDGSTLADALDRLCATVAVPAMFRQAGHPFPLPTDHEVALLRIAQSALTNTVQHADAGSARLDLTYLDDAVTLTVTDDGTGFNPAGAEIGGYGLAAMRARAVAVGGAFTVDSAVGAGATVAVRLPRVGLS